ncbi:MAG: hypothetical protein A2511_17665 [Deltaproteobacteria bacterium RIFOXYD12_FULL_50_9]|nr:MAG: hypothetical protein A2511_17665 [Deltaproteobacteria bacterium RIFOXYD12_FULL_50_9]
MVRGLGRFRDHFQDYTGQYVLIGGAACDLAMDEAGVDFRATKDLDIVLCVEALDRSFVEAFWSFVRAGEYQIQEKATGEKQFYRFKKPKKTGFPLMLELFSRAPDVLQTVPESHFVSIPVEDEAASLSAILLDEDYYAWIQKGRQLLRGVSVLDPKHIIPLKARAWLDLHARKAAGEAIDSRNIRKHRNDVFRLFPVLTPDPINDVPVSIKQDMLNFLVAMKEEEIDLSALGLGKRDKDDVLMNLQTIYGLQGR